MKSKKKRALYVPSYVSKFIKLSTLSTKVSRLRTTADIPMIQCKLWEYHLFSTAVLICVSQDLSESEQDLESSFMMLQNSVQEWLECKPLPITLQSKGRVERLRMGMNMEISTQPSPKLGESRKELYFSKPDLILPGLNIGKLNC